MKRSSLPHYLFLSGLLLTSANFTHADDNTPYINNNTPTSSTDNNSSGILTDLNELVSYIQNLGMYFGYDVTNYCPGVQGPCPSSSSSGGAPVSSSSSSASFSNLYTQSTTDHLLNDGIDAHLFPAYLGALLPSNQPAGQGAAPNFVLIPSSATGLPNDYASSVNNLANQSFNPYATTNATAPSVSLLIDQGQGGSNSGSFQNDPVNQSILNILATPDVSYCTNPNTGGLMTPTCSLTNTNETVLSQVQVMLNTIGATFSSSATTYPSPLVVASPSQNAALTPQLNSDTLLGPLMFDESSANATAPSGAAAMGLGATATNQVQQAANYIRYASGSVSPMTQPNSTAYTNLYARAIGGTNNTAADQLLAQSIIVKYLTNLRVYAAQTSVGISNLYYILSRRLPQKTTTNGSASQGPSQALSEFMMATWRLAPPAEDPTGKPRWVNEINSASSATVEKEIAVLLAEINYQMYLTRTQQERLLLTNSTLLLQSAHNTQPRPDLTQGPAAENTAPIQPAAGS